MLLYSQVLTVSYAENKLLGNRRLKNIVEGTGGNTF